MFIDELVVLLSQPISAKQATSASNENNFIVMCILIYRFLPSLPGQVGFAKEIY